MHSVYVHFPYCAAKCPYCDFGVHVVASMPQRAFTDALLIALDRRLEREPWPTEPAGSVYLGGGTPSLRNPARARGASSRASPPGSRWPPAPR